ncbi:hypothetical protein F5Y10DRAFT_268463 [Nemania abortiva]|nr:hypothetical protein F5Y10DRAFT_268463 [Nemania abortiva]
MLMILPASFVLFLLTLSCVADTVQDDWVFPQLPDGSTTLQLGGEYTIRWTSALQSWFQYFCPDCNTTSVDLWTTDSSSNKEHKLASGVDVATTLSIVLTATVPASELPGSPNWVLRFVPSEEAPSSTSEQISSPIFNIIDPDAASSSSISVSSSTVSSTPLVSTSSTPVASTNPTTTTSGTTSTETLTTPRSSSGLSTGAQAGIGVGAGVGAIALITLGWFLARSCGRKDSTLALGGTETQNRGPGPFVWGKVPHELHGMASQMPHQNQPPQIFSQPPVEVDSSPAYRG